MCKKLVYGTSVYWLFINYACIGTRVKVLWLNKPLQITDYQDTNNNCSFILHTYYHFKTYLFKI
jgi:hypothetical protein